jgi:hypothetical protein
MSTIIANNCVSGTVCMALTVCARAWLGYIRVCTALAVSTSARSLHVGYGISPSGHDDREHCSTRQCTLCATQAAFITNCAIIYTMLSEPGGHNPPTCEVHTPLTRPAVALIIIMLHIMSHQAIT